MFRNYITIAIRNLMKHRTFSAINVFGLTIGLTACILIAAFISNELSYDTYAEHAHQLYRIELQITQNGGVVNIPMLTLRWGPELKVPYPEVLTSSRITGPKEMFVRNGDKLFKESQMSLFVIPISFRCFQFH